MSKIHLSKMSGKLKGFLSINTNPINNEFCIKTSANENMICSKCYSLRMLSTYRANCVKNFEENSKLLSENIISEKDLPDYSNHKRVRINSHGELINDNHYINIVNLAKKNPTVTFSLYTKRKDLVWRLIKKGYFAENIIYIYSSLKINPGLVGPPRGFEKTFSVFTKEYIDKNNIAINCGGKSCANCLLCYGHNSTKFVNEIIK